MLSFCTLDDEAHAVLRPNRLYYLQKGSRIIQEGNPKKDRQGKRHRLENADNMILRNRTLPHVTIKASGHYLKVKVSTVPRLWRPRHPHSPTNSADILAFVKEVRSKTPAQRAQEEVIAGLSECLRASANVDRHLSAAAAAAASSLEHSVKSTVYISQANAQDSIPGVDQYLSANGTFQDLKVRDRRRGFQLLFSTGKCDYGHRVSVLSQLRLLHSEFLIFFIITPGCHYPDAIVMRTP